MTKKRNYAFGIIIGLLMTFFSARYFHANISILGLGYKLEERQSSDLFIIFNESMSINPHRNITKEFFLKNFVTNKIFEFTDRNVEWHNKPIEKVNWTSESIWSSDPIYSRMGQRADNARRECRKTEKFASYVTSLRFLERLPVCWLVDNNWSRDPDIPSCPGSDGATGRPWPAEISKIQCPNSYSMVFPYHGLAIQAYLKCGSQLADSCHRKVNSVPDWNYFETQTPIEWRHRTTMYASSLAVMQTYIIRTINTSQGPSVADYVKLCDFGHQALIVRHPVVRWVSSWNDKFSWNSTAGAGFAYGLRFWGTPRMQKEYPSEFSFLTGMHFSEIQAKHEFAAQHNIKFKSIGNKFPRKEGKTPWHLLDLEKWIIAVAKKGYVPKDQHFLPYYKEMQRHPCNNYFNLIIRQENLGEEFGFLANHLKMKKEDCDPNQVYHSNSNSLSSSVLKYEKYLDTVPAQIKQVLYDFLEDDLKIFGYGWNLTTNKLTF